MFSKKPTSLTQLEAAPVPVVAVTAWQALFDHAQLKAGQTVLLHGAAGNVGAYAVQLARRAVLRTIRTAATDDRPFVCNLGANAVIDYRTQRFEEEVRDADAVIDLVGGDTQERSFQVLRLGGKLISTVSPPDQHLAQSHGVEPAYFLVNVTSQRLAEIAGLIDGGQLRTHVVVQFSPSRMRGRLISCWNTYGLSRKERPCLPSAQVESDLACVHSAGWHVRQVPRNGALDVTAVSEQRANCYSQCNSEVCHDCHRSGDPGRIQRDADNARQDRRLQRRRAQGQHPAERSARDHRSEA